MTAPRYILSAGPDMADMGHRLTVQRIFRWLFVILIAASGMPCRSAAPLNIFVSIQPQKYLVDRIGGDTVSVSVLVQPGESPATFEPTPRQMASLSSADLFIRIGVPFESALIPRIASINPKLRIEDGGAGVRRHSISNHDHGHDHGEGHASLMDPHIWLSPVLLQTQVATVAAVLSELRPADAPVYAERAGELNSELAALHTRLSGLLAPYAGSAFYIFHPVLGYFAREYGLEQIAVEQSGKPPSPRQLAALITRARQENVRVIFVQREFDRAVAQSIAEATGAGIVILDPLAENVPVNLRIIAERISEALTREPGSSPSPVETQP